MLATEHVDVIDLPGCRGRGPTLLGSLARAIPVPATLGCVVDVIRTRLGKTRTLQPVVALLEQFAVGIAKHADLAIDRLDEPKLYAPLAPIVELKKEIAGIGHVRVAPN